MIRRKKAGSALITTVILFAFITTVSTAFLSLSAGNYKARIVENKRIQNLYGAESGLDTAYNIIENTVSVACAYGDNEVKKLKYDIKEDFEKVQVFNKDGYDKIKDSEDEKLEIKKKIYALYADIDYAEYCDKVKDDEKKDRIDKDKYLIDKVYNKYFQDKFKEFIDDNIKTYVVGNEGIYITVKVNEENFEFKTEKEKLSYDNATISVLDNEDKEIDKIIWYYNANKKSDSNTDESNLINKNEYILHIENGVDNENKIKYEKNNIIIEEFKDINTDLILLSSFKTKEKNVSIGENERKIQATYDIRIPNYSEIAFKTSENIKKVEKDLPKLTVGGDLNVNKVNNFNVSGDIFVEGNKINSIDKTNRTFAKYNGGIILDNSEGVNESKINFKDNVYSRGTLNIKNNVNINVNNNLYAKNVYAGNGKNNATGSRLKVKKDTIIDNDLTMKAKNTVIELNNFYGINDRSSSNSEKPMKSSSIIINNTEAAESTVNIANEAYIAGVAHIDTESGYETGESVAVKGNYEAYSKTVTGNEKFKYDNPLQVLDEDNVFNKAEHFKNYWNNKAINCGGVIFGNINSVKSAGAVVGNDGQVLVSKSRIEDFTSGKIVDKRNAYAEKVFNIIVKDKNEDMVGYEEEPEKVRNILGENFAGKVSSIARSGEKYDETQIFNGSKSFNEELNYNGNIIVNGSVEFNKPVNIIGNVIVNGSVEFREEANIKGVIIQRGELKFNKQFDLRGNLIVDGNLIFDNSEDVNLTYDKIVTENMQNKYGKIFNDIFGDGYGGEIIENDTDGIIKGNSINFVKSKLWKIKKNHN